MRNLNRLLPAVLLLIAACASKTPPTAAAPAPQAATTVVKPAEPEAPAATRPMRPGLIPIPSRGLSCRSAVPVEATTEADGAAKETAWIAENYPGATKASQSRITCEGKTVDQIELDTANGRRVTLFFDASGWSAKPK
ncbi:MAG: hypothetical protein QOK37_3103 [Thermoanaerobaculia bacterium]|jgi:hypothetical protein|nr:hypothetical protein [Thermoanaerobaculia bacterium]